MSWIGPRLASQGFVVIGIQTNSLLDRPADRATELNAALTWATTRSTVASRIDPNRLGVAGWSMGSGGALDATLTNPRLKAAVALAPWNPNKTYLTERVPTMIIAGQNDNLAPVAQHGRAFYNSMLTAEKAYVEIKGGDHYFPFLPKHLRAARHDHLVQAAVGQRHPLRTVPLPRPPGRSHHP